jgi:hypothetical protein
MKKQVLCNKVLCPRFSIRKIIAIINCACALTFLLSLPAYAIDISPRELITTADVIVKGQVTDAKGMGIPGVSIKLKGTVIATTTGNDGRYTIEVPDNGVLVFTFIGYVTSEQPVSGRTSINVKMQENSQALTEVV